MSLEYEPASEPLHISVTIRGEGSDVVIPTPPSPRSLCRPLLLNTGGWGQMTIREEGGDVARAAVRCGILTATKDTLKRVPDKV